MRCGIMLDAAGAVPIAALQRSRPLSAIVGDYGRPARPAVFGRRRTTHRSAWLYR